MKLVLIDSGPGLVPERALSILAIGLSETVISESYVIRENHYYREKALTNPVCKIAGILFRCQYIITIMISHISPKFQNVMTPTNLQMHIAINVTRDMQNQDTMKSRRFDHFQMQM